MKTLFYLLLCSSLLVSCGKSTQTKLKVSIGALTVGEDFPGGLWIVGQHGETQQMFSKVVPKGSSEILFELENGQWKFMAIAWDGGADRQSFEGQAACDVKEGIELAGDELALDFVLSANNCDHNIYGQSYDRGTGNFNPIKFYSCSGISNDIEIGTLPEPGSFGCGSSERYERGNIKSVRIVLMNKELLDDESKVSRGAVSRCIDFRYSEIEYELSQIGLPRGEADSRVLFPYMVEAFTDAGCDRAVETPQRYFFSRGFVKPSFNLKALGVGSSGYTYLFMDSEPLNAGAF